MENYKIKKEDFNLKLKGSLYRRKGKIIPYFLLNY